ncbi:hypothetical protein ACE1SV_71860 [Streptomyces sennicomposti]
MTGVPRVAVVVDVMRAFAVAAWAFARAAERIVPAASEDEALVLNGYRGIHPDDIAVCLEADRFPVAMAVRREGPHTVLRPAIAAAGRGGRCLAPEALLSRPFNVVKCGRVRPCPGRRPRCGRGRPVWPGCVLSLFRLL